METTVQPGSRVRALEALRHRDFRLLFAGQVVSLLGDAAFVTALSWKTFTLAGSAKLGVVLLCESLATTATLLLGGTLADRYPRRRLMIASDLARFAAVGALAVADAAGVLSFPLLLVFATLMGAGDGFFTPAFGGIVPLVVEQPHLASANSLIGVARYGSLLVGPALAAILYGATGSATVFAFDALSFVLSAALLWRARPRAFEPAERTGAFREIREGVRYVAGIPWLWVTIALFGVVLMLQYAPQQVLLPKLVAEQWHRGVGGFGALMAMVGVGTVVGTLLFGQLQPRQRRGVVAYVLWLLNALAILGIALSPWYETAALLAVLRGFCIGFSVAVWETILQELVPDHLLARVVSLDYFGTFGLMPVGLALAAAVSSLAPPGAIIATGAAISSCLFVCVLTRPWLREVD